MTALRRMHGELGLSLKELEGRLPASRSSLSRYLRGQSLPDERLLIQWGKLSFTAEDRLPELVTLLHRATEAEAAIEAADGPTASAAAPPAPEEARAGSPEDRPSRRRLRLTLAAVGTVVVIGGATAGVIALRSSDDDSSPGGAGSSPLGNAQITVYNAEKTCQHKRVRECSLGLAEDPYQAYRPSNITGRAWHGDVLRADCRIANGVTVTDEAGGHSSMWFRVAKDGKRMWVPGIRIRQDQVQYSTLPNCPD
ncbi:helix-turn-helix domain-containing protein [Streptomyces rapamycinicus]|uniref:Transcriptional regulator with XRE-family HTH domain n=1 Tax=Streptomyces rapamycinicus TaxID=1226757 RepID=A0ABR6LR43_9ACTN|nr:helix-turn-helix transcriptional regulator [Streptomyces rapamycinicus]MBB4784053.1 transcriptional regulator with XRE-family HTH domain [Streptomyces rapamycinicus]UTO64396.1 helix-turn-helix domain-containing protein [Streptomyces rapamycinicus]UTP32352.1 helix-turn-helix domain-containing protein [Streptomyces rapamycinicus NRRL 5491]